MKPILKSQDLAINGAPPAFDQPLHVGCPNIGSREAFLKYVDDIFERRWLNNNGPLVQRFEQRVADHHGVKHCVAMCNGTVALEIAIRGLELEGEMIVLPYTFIATAHGPVTLDELSLSASKHWSSNNTVSDGSVTQEL